MCTMYVVEMYIFLSVITFNQKTHNQFYETFPSSHLCAYLYFDLFNLFELINLLVSQWAVCTRSLPFLSDSDPFVLFGHSRWHPSARIFDRNSDAANEKIGD